MLGLALELTSVHLGCTGTLNSRVMSISINYFIDRWRILLAVTWKIAHARGPARRSDTGIVDWHRTEFLRIRTSLPASCTGWLCNDLSGSYWLSVTAALDGRSNTWVIRITELPMSLTDMSSSVYTCCSAARINRRRHVWEISMQWLDLTAMALSPSSSSSSSSVYCTKV